MVPITFVLRADPLQDNNSVCERTVRRVRELIYLSIGCSVVLIYGFYPSWSMNQWIFPLISLCSDCVT